MPYGLFFFPQKFFFHVLITHFGSNSIFLKELCSTMLLVTFSTFFPTTPIIPVPFFFQNHVPNPKLCLLREEKQKLPSPMCRAWPKFFLSLGGCFWREPTCSLLRDNRWEPRCHQRPRGQLGFAQSWLARPSQGAPTLLGEYTGVLLARGGDEASSATLHSVKGVVFYMESNFVLPAYSASYI